MTTEQHVRYLAAGLAVTAVIAVVSVGWLVWIAADPEYWFPGAYAESHRSASSGRT